MNKAGVLFTSIGLAAMIAASPISLKQVSAAENGDNYSYNISYIRDESKANIEDNYDEELMEKYRNAPDDMIVEIPEEFKYEVVGHISNKSEDDVITVGDLRSIDYLMLDISDDTVGDVDLSWLNYCTNLKYLYLYGDIIQYTDDILGFDNIDTIILTTRYGEEIMDLRNCGFINHCPTLKTLSISGLYDAEQLYGLNVKHLSLDVKETHTVDFKKLDFLDELTLYGGAYDIAIYLSNDDIDYLESKDVKISFGTIDNVDIDQIREINDKLDEIVESLGLDENATDEEKIRAVLIYVLSNLEYDEYASECQEKGINYDHDPFYQDGELYGALEGESQICGNYAALTSALLHRLGVDVYFVTSDSHAWNLVEVDGEWYYFDSTWLDDDKVTVWEEKWEDIPGGKTLTITPVTLTVEEVLASGDQEGLDQLLWYKVVPSDYKADPDKYHDKKVDKRTGEEYYSHDVNDFPITIVEVQTENTDSNVSSEEENSSSVDDATVSNVSSEETNSSSVDDVTASNDNSKNTPKDDKNFGKKLFDVTIGNKVFRRVSGAALIGLLAGLGIAIPVRRKKKREEEERIRQLNNMYFGPTDYSIPHDYYSSRNRGRRRNKNRPGTYYDSNDDQYGGGSRLL